MPTNITADNKYLIIVKTILFFILLTITVQLLNLLYDSTL
jgi:hypothetical protein